MENGEIIIYQTEDGEAQIDLSVVDGTVWLSQQQIAQLFNTSKQNISLHLKNIIQDKELEQDAVIKESLTTAADNKQYAVSYYNLDAILAVGYRVRSPRGVQFRRWANTILKEYLIKGFAMNDERLKQAEQWDYFDEWLERIRAIRASEKRFYQKVRDLYATAIDYDKTSEEAKLFFQKTQNKMLWAVTGRTAAELIAERSNPNQSNMGVNHWRGSVVRKGDVGTAKNYLNKEEIQELDRIVTMYLDYAEDQAKRRKTVTMEQWSEKLDAFLSFNERELLTHAGNIRMDVAKALAAERYQEFDQKRRAQAAKLANAEDIKELEALEAKLLGKEK